MGKAELKDGEIRKPGEEEEAATPEPQGFDVALVENEIWLEAKQNGKLYSLLHVLRTPTTAEWLAFQKELGGAGRKVTPNKQPEPRDLQAGATLWAEVVIRVKGYMNGPEALVCEGNNWMRQVPIHHRYNAVQVLGAVYDAGEETAKNSKTASGDF